VKLKAAEVAAKAKDYESDFMQKLVIAANQRIETANESVRQANERASKAEIRATNSDVYKRWVIIALTVVAVGWVLREGLAIAMKR
jgi:hypothetical protein